MSELFLPSGSFLETNILLASISSVLNMFLFGKSHFFYFFVAQIYAPFAHFYIR